MTKYYLEKSGERCWPLSEFKDRIKAGEKEIILLEAKRDFGEDMFCKEESFFPEKGDCGRDCKDYNPCNGISGKCRFLENALIETGRKFKLNYKGLDFLTG